MKKNTSKTIKWMLYMPKFNLITCTACDLNKFPFYTKSKDDTNIKEKIINVI